MILNQDVWNSCVGLVIYEKKSFSWNKNDFSILKCGREMKMLYKRKYDELKQYVVFNCYI
jgi:hypothetical protein